MQSEQTNKKCSYQKGTVYGRLTLTGKNRMQSMYGQLRRVVEADCECGVVKWFLLNSLVIGETKSCGCLRSDVSRERMTTHGLTNHLLYAVYHAMIDRCYMVNTKQYSDYGGRGIEVCDEWQANFVTFYEWAMANGWEEGKTLDRRDNDKNYDSHNCWFVGGKKDRKTQSRNTRRNVLITAFGETKCLFDWAADQRCKVTCWALRSRYDRGKWTDMEAMIVSPQTERKKIQRSMKSNRMFTAFGETKCMSAWLEDSRCLVKIDSFRDRINKGWDAEKAMSTQPLRDGKNQHTVIYQPVQ